MNASHGDRERVVLAIDGVHGFGIEDFDLGSLGLDFFAAGCHKWLFGPRGTGILWGSSRGWAASNAAHSELHRRRDVVGLARRG